jgi:hypothetical protein
MRANEPLIGYLERNENVAHFAAHGDTLAIAVSYLPPLNSDAGSLPKAQSAVILVSKDTPLVRTPLKIGSIRTIVATPSGFVAARVTYDRDAKSTANFFGIDLDGMVTEMSPLQIDLVGLWVDADGTIFAYSPRAVFRWIAASSTWEMLLIDPAVNADAIRRIVTLRNGSSLVVTDRNIKGFKHLQEPPVFVKNLSAYPKPIFAYGDDCWWIIMSDERTSRISIVNADGKMREVASLRVVTLHNILYNGDKAFIVCAREGGNLGKYSYYTLNRDGSGPLRGPFMLPSGATISYVWNNSIISSGISNRIFMTTIEDRAINK